MFKIISGMAAAAMTFAFGSAVARTQTPIPPAANDFAAMAAQSNQYEILAGHDAFIQATDPRVRAFAQQMIDDYTRASDDLRKAAESSGLQPPPVAIGGDQARLLGALQSLRGAEFDRTYVLQQVLAHDAALAVAQSYAAAGTNLKLRAAARAVVPMIQHRLQIAQQLHTTLNGF